MLGLVRGNVLEPSGDVRVLACVRSLALVEDGNVSLRGRVAAMEQKKKQRQKE